MDPSPDQRPTTFDSLGPFGLRLVGVGTLLFTIVSTTLSGLGLLSATFVEQPSDLGLVIADARAIVCLVGVIPAGAALLASRAARPLHLLWALAVCLGEAASTFDYASTHTGPQLVALLCTVPAFLAWPVICLALFWRR